MADRHKHPQLQFRATEGNREWLLDYAAETGRPVGALLSEALEAFRQQQSGTTTPEPAKAAGAATAPARAKPARPVAAPASESPRKPPSAERGACPHRLPPGAFCKRCAVANGG